MRLRLQNAYDLAQNHGKSKNMQVKKFQTA